MSKKRHDCSCQCHRVRREGGKKSTHCNGISVWAHTHNCILVHATTQACRWTTCESGIRVRMRWRSHVVVVVVVIVPLNGRVIALQIHAFATPPYTPQHLTEPPSPGRRLGWYETQTANSRQTPPDHPSPVHWHNMQRSWGAARCGRIHALTRWGTVNSKTLEGWALNWRHYAVSVSTMWGRTWMTTGMGGVYKGVVGGGLCWGCYAVNSSHELHLMKSHFSQYGPITGFDHCKLLTIAGWLITEMRTGQYIDSIINIVIWNEMRTLDIVIWHKCCLFLV